MGKYSKAVLFYNRKSGQSDSYHQLKTIQEHFNQLKTPLIIHTVPEKAKNIKSIISNAINEGADLFIAAGGDGTVSLVANPLVGTEKPLGILPIGTGNLLAKELKIPRHIEDALNLISGNSSRMFSLDTFTLDDHNYVLNVSAGVTPKVMEKTQSEEKQRLGVFAYLIHFFEQLFGLKLERFDVEYDHVRESYIASEVLITNGRLMGVENLEWSDDITLNDGMLDIFIIRAANIIDILSFVFSAFTKQKRKNPIVKSIRFREYCRIETQTPLKVQADGDPVGKTPIEIHVKPHALTIIVPDEIKEQDATKNI